MKKNLMQNINMCSSKSKEFEIIIKKDFSTESVTLERVMN